MQVEFYKHNVDDAAKQAMLEILDTPYIAQGEGVRELESRFSEYIGTEHSAAVATCTDALYLSLRVLGIGLGDEVITTPLTFVATANSIAMVSATPVFADVDPLTGLIDIDQIEKKISQKTKAIIPVHLYGQMVDMRKLSGIAKRFDLKIIEDCAHCIEGHSNGIRPGELSDTACFSFFATKNITSGEGGMLTTSSEELDSKVRMLRSHGQTRSADQRYKQTSIGWDVEIPGLNHKMTNFQAAMLIPQLEKIESLWQRRFEIYQRYSDAFAEKNIPMPLIQDGNKSGLHLFTIWVERNKRDDFLRRLKEQGVNCTVNYNPVHLLSYYRKQFGYKNGDFLNAEHIGFSTISLPLYPSLKEEEIKYVIEKVCQIVRPS